MAENLTIARPYAEAVFQLAKEQNALPRWSGMLQLAAAVATSPDIQALIGNPRITPKQLGDLFLGICGDRLDGAARNFVLVLIENRRLALLPEIGELFEQLRAAHEGEVEATITTAFPLTDAQVQEIAGRLQAKYRRRILPRVVVQPELIGGVKLQVGDEVTDGSLRGRLDAMAQTLAQ